jgi:phage gp29-like protein
VGKDVLLYDGLGNELRRVEKAPPAPQAAVGRTFDRWSGKSAGEITPELAARVLRGDADLSLQMSVTKRLLKDPYIFACMRNLAYAASRKPWTVSPFDEKSAAAKKQADELRQFFNSRRWLKKLFRYLIFGEFYPFSAAGLVWNREYELEDYIRINPVRWRRDLPTNSLRLEVQNGSGVTWEPIDRRGYVIYQAELEPGTPWERGLWQKALWLWIFGNCTWAWWIRFAEQFGNPYIWAFFKRKEDKESVHEAVLGMDANARGVFPEGTEIKLQEAQRYGTNALYSAIIDASHDGLAKLILGHVLSIEAKAGAGTLAGNHAEQVSDVVVEGVTENLGETIQEDITIPWGEWHYGEDAVAKGEIPLFEINADPPEDQSTRSKVYLQVNEALAPSGLTIDPVQIEQEMTVRTVKRTVEVPAIPAPATSDPTKQQKRIAQSANEPRIKSLDDVRTVTTKLIARAAEDFSTRIAEIFDQADSIEAGADAIWEGYSALDTTRLASGLRDATITAELMGRGDVQEEGE